MKIPTIVKSTINVRLTRFSVLLVIVSVISPNVTVSEIVRTLGMNKVVHHVTLATVTVQPINFSVTTRFVYHDDGVVTEMMIAGTVQMNVQKSAN